MRWGGPKEEKLKPRQGTGETAWDGLAEAMPFQGGDDTGEARTESGEYARAGKLGAKVLAATDVAEARGTAEDKAGETLDGQARLELMRENWGDFEKSRALFGPKTEMVPYEYGVIAENMPWEEFTHFCADMAELGRKSEYEYEEALLDKGSELGEKGLCLPRSLAIAVRRYNVAKELSEVEPEAKFYYATSLQRAIRVLGTGQSRVIEGDWDADYDHDGRDERRLHFTHDQTVDGAKQSGLEPDAGMVTMVFDRSIMDDDEFDIVAGVPAMNRVGEEHLLAVLGRDEMITDMFLIAQNREGKKRNYEIMSAQDWLNDGESVETEAERKHRRNRLLKEAIVFPNKKEMREFVDSHLEKVDGEELERLREACQQDMRTGANEAADYFAKILGTERRKVIWDPELKKGEGRHLTMGGNIKLSAKDLKARPETIIEEIAHEMFHEYQSQLEGQWERGELEPGTLEDRRARLNYFNTQHYDTGDGSPLSFYENQVKEVEAYYFGGKVKKRLKQALRRK